MRKLKKLSSGVCKTGAAMISHSISKNTCDTNLKLSFSENKSTWNKSESWWRDRKNLWSTALSKLSHRSWITNCRKPNHNYTSIRLHWVIHLCLKRHCSQRRLKGNWNWTLNTDHSSVMQRHMHRWCDRFINPKCQKVKPTQSCFKCRDKNLNREM